MIRPIHLPNDLRVIPELLEKGFQYPENPTWSAQADQGENLREQMNSGRRLWPLIRLGQLISPALRDVFQGYIWEEDARPVGLVVIQNLGSTNTWIISAVAVLPQFRRRGIARALIEVAIDSMRQRGAKTIILTVIKENLPARLLYEELGFVTYLNTYEFELTQELQVERFSGNDLVFSPVNYFNNKPRLSLLNRITPPFVAAYEPVVSGSFFVDVISFLLGKLSGMQEDTFVLMDDQVIAYGEVTARKKPGGMNQLYLRLDPAHPELADKLLRYLIGTTQRISPGRRIEFSIPEWQEVLIEAALATGCIQRIHYVKMGLRL